MKEQGIISTKIPDVLELTYVQLSALITGNQLTVGRKYLIIDYQTVHTIPGTTDTNTGPTEPLLVTALRTNELEPIAYSTLHPDDIIYYEWDNSLTYKVSGATKGFIYRRLDTKENIDIPFDFRNVKFRRWEIDVPTVWDINTVYTTTSIVVGSDDYIYLSMVNGNTGNDPVLDTYHWMKFNFKNNTYTSHLISGIPLNGYTIPVSANYQDLIINVGSDTTITYGGIYNRTINVCNLVFVNGTTRMNLSFTTTATGTIGFVRDSVIKTNQFSTIYIDTITTSYINTENLVQLYIRTIDDCIINSNLSGCNLKIIDDCNFFRSSISSLTVNYSGLGFGFFKNNFYGDINGLKILFGSSLSFSYNNIYDLGASAALLDFLSATHVFGNYTKEWVRNSNGQAVLKYIDSTNTQQFVNPTA